MGNPFERLLNEKVKVIEADGEVLVEELPCIVQSDHLKTFEVSHQYSQGQLILRALPNDLLEQYEITDVTYHAGKPPRIPDSFDLHFQKTGKKPAPLQTIITNISGHNARVNINSEDHSKNQYNIGPEDIFQELMKLLEGVQPDDERRKLQASASQMEATKGTDDFLRKYKEFMGLAANHVAVLGPIFPALATLL